MNLHFYTVNYILFWQNSGRKGEVIIKQQKSGTALIFHSAFSLLISAALIFSVVTLFKMNRSVAWFAQNDEVSASGISVTAKDLRDARVNLAAYAVTEIDIVNNVYTLADEQSYTLPPHDPNNISYDAHKKALVVLIEIHSTKDTTASVALRTDNATVEYTLQNVISNCMKITPATFASGSTRTATLNGASQSFISKEDNALTKTTSLILSERITLKANESQTLCYVIEYNQDFFDHVFKMSFDDNNTSESGTTNNTKEMIFKNDIDFVITYAQ